MKVEGPVLLDIDRTIFDTDHFGKLTSVGLAVKTGVQLEKFELAEEEYISTLASGIDFRAIDYVVWIGRVFGVSPLVLLDEFLMNNEYYVQSLFPDTIDVLERLRCKVGLGVYSEGDLNFQRNKLERMGIVNYFLPQNIYIFERKLTDEVICRLPKGSVVVDDKRSIVEGLAECGVQAVWINRKSEERHPLIPTIFQLNELLRLFTESEELRAPLDT